MSIATIILGSSGTGKSTSLRNFDPAECLLIQAVKKPLPFRSSGWKIVDKTGGNVVVSDQPNMIVHALTKTSKKIIIIDDSQYIMANSYMRRSQETGFQKFADIGRETWDIYNTATNLADDVRVYFLSHTEQLESGHTKIKTIGRMLDEKICLEGLVSIVLQTAVVNGNYLFLTHNNGQNTVKSPIGLFEEEMIPNDLKAVDVAICEYYGI